ncbi:ABC transporter permease [Siccirubricoccus phaeus]|uniref:ABC transporter permease n=1 Tax=Siccirubricoccus phaeus TaxID=2595053 RepID=UPI0011F0D60A|nr:ABC transporter permease [Siccirubricoccus phaeus]
MSDIPAPGPTAGAAPGAAPLARRLALPEPARLLNILLPLLLLAGVGLAWWGAVKFFAIPEYLLPSPIAVAQKIAEDAPLFWRHTKATAAVVLLGFLVSAVLGIGLALAVVLNRTLERMLMPLIVGSQTIPKVAIAPLFVVWLGFGLPPKVAVTFLISFFPVVVASVTGLKAVEADMLDLVRSMGAGAVKSILKVRIPTALPQIFAGLKIAICSAVVGAIVAEFVGSDVGLGYLLLTSTATLDGPLVWSALLILVAMGIALFVAVVQLERLVIPWHVSIRNAG